MLLDRIRSLTGIHQLRVNVKSLATEARLIRQEERKVQWHPNDDKNIWYDETASRRGELYWHRVGPLREEARIANLTLAYVKGRAYKEVEASCRELPCHIRLQSKWKKFGVRGDAAKWLLGQNAISKAA